MEAKEEKLVQGYRANGTKERLKLMGGLCILRREQRKRKNELSIVRKRRLHAVAPAGNRGLAGDRCRAAAVALLEVQTPILRTSGGPDFRPARALSAMREP